MVPLKVHKGRDTRSSLINHLLPPLARHVRARHKACSSRVLDHHGGINGFSDESNTHLLLPHPPARRLQDNAAVAGAAPSSLRPSLMEIDGCGVCGSIEAPRLLQEPESAPPGSGWAGQLPQPSQMSRRIHSLLPNNEAAG